MKQDIDIKPPSSGAGEGTAPVNGRRAGRRSAASTKSGYAARSHPGSLARTKSLVLAAIKVWELKRGIRD